MAETWIIESLFEDYKKILDALLAAKETSLYVAAKTTFIKTLTIASASYFEDQVKIFISNLVQEKTGGYSPIMEFVNNKGIERQYHTYFDWNGNSANLFFSLFGDQIKTSASAYIDTTPSMKDDIKAFLEIGSLRNQLAHKNFTTFLMTKELSEIFELSKSGLSFINSLHKLFGLS
jgi:hypothetical protein